MAEKMKYAKTTKATPKTMAERFSVDKELPKMSIAATRIALIEAYEYINSFKDVARCRICGVAKPTDKFYYNAQSGIAVNYSPVCKNCLHDIAYRKDSSGQEHEPTKESCIEALKAWGRPFLQIVWDASVNEADNMITGKTKSTVWESYCKNIQMRQYIDLNFFDSDFFINGNTSEPTFYEDEYEARDAYQASKMSDGEMSDYERNKADVIKLLGYDPYVGESVSDGIQLYSQLIEMLDAGGDENDDMVRNQSCIAICRGFLQVSKIDSSISLLMADAKNIESNAASIKSLQASKKDVLSYITNLAAESCISLKNSRNKSKGDNTWTGKLKKIREMDLARTNGFDIKTCKGMQQVQEISDASIMKQLALDDSEWSDMVAEMRQIIVSLRDEKDAYQEINRILLKENLDLRDTLEDNNLLNVDDLKDLRGMYSVFSDLGNDESNENKSEDQEEADNES